MARWFEGDGFLWLSPVPLLLATWLLWRAIPRDGQDARPFVLSLSLFLLGFAALLLGMWPYIVPPSLIIWQAAAPPATQGFALAGLALPAILGYRCSRGRSRRMRGIAENMPVHACACMSETKETRIAKT